MVLGMDHCPVSNGDMIADGHVSFPIDIQSVKYAAIAYDGCPCYVHWTPNNKASSN